MEDYLSGISTFLQWILKYLLVSLWTPTRMLYRMETETNIRYTVGKSTCSEFSGGDCGASENNTDVDTVVIAKGRQIGVVSATFLIFNRIIGTGIFATPSAILAQTGSVGMSLVVWIIGMLIAMAGTAVYLEFGTAIPRFGSYTSFCVCVKCRFLSGD
ncbi:hypothetical protein H113_02006 [Trichophyton rubrum MR1459]|nr:hypothetical protein H113_02006 [Trichophyton rubrum MR1459]EZG08947.1 hypothetical protein H106_01863 [Trichophyton rubrum CBS 735.88]